MKKRYGIAAVLAAALGAWWLLTLGQADHRVDRAAAVRFTAVHVNSPDPERMARFYLQVVGGSRVAANDAGGAGSEPVIRLRTAGYRGEGPLLVLRATPASPGRSPLKASDRGYAHICFEADDVPAAVRRIRAHGGTILSTFDEPERVPVIYAADPDGSGGPADRRGGRCHRGHAG